MNSVSVSLRPNYRRPSRDSRLTVEKVAVKNPAFSELSGSLGWG